MCSYKLVDAHEAFSRIEDDERIRNVASKSYEKEKFFVEVELCTWKFKGETHFTNGVSRARLGEDPIRVRVTSRRGVEYLKKHG